MKKCCLMAIVLGMSCFNMSGWAMADCDEKPSCSDLGYIAEYDECTNGRRLDCPFDGYGYFCKSPDNGTNCVFGSTLYDDLKCYASSEVPAGRVPIGKVTNPFKTLAMALDETELPYGAVGVTQEIFSPGATTDKEKTKRLVEEVGDSSDYAAGYCYNYKTKGTNKGDWFLSHRMFSADMFSTTGTTWKGFAWITGIDIRGKEYWGIDMTDSEGAFVSYKENVSVRSDRTELHSVRCLINYTDVVVLTPKTCKVGDVLYSDLKCYDETPSGLTAIGVVFDTTNRLAISLEVKKVGWRLSGETNTKDVPGLQNCTSENVVVDCDTDGKANTKAIVAYFGGSSDYAAGYCHNYTTEGTKKGDWFLPSMKELMVLGDFIVPVNATWQGFGGSVSGRKYLNGTYYSSNEADRITAKGDYNVFGLYASATPAFAQYLLKYYQVHSYHPDTICVINY